MTGEQYNKGNGMSGFWKKRFAIHRAASTVVLAVYLIITTSIDLFHSEDCMFGAEQPGTTDAISCNNPCPACMFLAGYNSTNANYGSTLVSTESLLISQFLPHLTIVNHDEWACSITLRAPPSITIS